jgi:hypothetical protein
MNSKLTFEAKIEGGEKLLEVLSKIEAKTKGLGESGGTAFDALNRSLKDFETSLQYLAKQQSGLGGVSKLFDDISTKAYKATSETRMKILDAYKDKSKDLESFIKTNETQIDQLQKKLGEFENRRKDSLTKEDIANQTVWANNLNKLKSQNIAATVDLVKAQNQIWQQSPFFNQNAINFLSKFGGPGAQLGAMTNVAGFGLAGALMASTASALKTGIQLPGAYYGMESYERSLQPANQLLAQRAVQQYTAAAIQGDYTNAILRRAGLGVEAREASSPSGLMADRAESTLSSRGFQATISGLLGGASVAGVVGTAALLAKLGVAGLATVATGGVALPLIAAGVAVGGTYGYMSAKPISQQEAYAKRISQLAEKDKQLYDITLGQAGRNLDQESSLHGNLQRMFGIDQTHINTANLMQQKVADMSDLADMRNRLGQYGIREMRDATFGVFSERYGMSSEAAKSQLARTAAALGGGKAGEYFAIESYKDLAARAGFSSQESMPGRQILADYASQLALQQGFGQTSVSYTGAGAANIASAIGANLPSQVAATTAVDLSNVFRERQTRSGGITNTLLKMALSKMGITSPFVQTALIEQGLNNKDVRNSIKEMVAEGVDVDAILDEATQAENQAIGETTGIKEGSEAWEQLKKAKLDPKTWLLTRNKKLAADVFLGNMTADKAYQEFMSQKETKIDTTKVQGGISVEDEKSGLRAQISADIEAVMQKLANEQGASVANIIRQATVDGFRNMSDQIASAGGFLFNSKKSTGLIEGVQNALQNTFFPNVSPTTVSPVLNPPQDNTTNNSTGKKQ